MYMEHNTYHKEKKNNIKEIIKMFLKKGEEYTQNKYIHIV